MSDVTPASDEEIEFILDCDVVSADMVTALVARIKDAETRTLPTLTPDERKRRNKVLAYNRAIDPNPHTVEAFLQQNVGQLLRIIDRLTGEATDG